MIIYAFIVLKSGLFIVHFLYSKNPQSFLSQENYIFTEERRKEKEKKEN